MILVPASVAGQAQFAVVRSFDGSEPIEPQFAPQIRATDGNSYGTTVRGGPADAGTVFRMASDGTMAVLYAFTGGSDGASPSAGLIQGTDGHLYGTTERGGTADAGTVFRMTLAGSFTVLHRFAYTDGANPGPLVLGSDGNLYGTTRNGGDFSAGTIFTMTPAGTVTVLHSFTGGADGGSPRPGLIQATDLSLHGTTDTGGALGMGTAFRLDAVAPPQGVFTVRGGGDLDWVPSAGGFGPTIASSPTSASGTLLDPNGSAAYTIAAGPGVVRGSLAGSFTDLGRFNPSIQADASSELTLVGPTGFVAIPVSLNLHVDSTFTIEQCPDSCNVSIGVIGHGGITRFSIGAGFTENGLGLTADPIPGGYHLHGDVATPQFGLTPNLPTSVGISLQINDNNLNHGYAGASVFAVGPSIVSFAPNGPVLNGVPAGYTVSGPGIVDNHWTDPIVPDIELQFDDGTPMPANPVVDLGNVASGSVVEGGYRIANTGIAPLEVTDVAAELLAAGVAEAPVPTSPSIAPGDSTPAVVRCGGTNPGPDAREVMFDVKISSDDPDESPIYFRARCTVLPEPVGRPIIELRFADGTPMPANAELDLGEVASGSVAEGSYLIANIGDGRLQVADVQVARYSAFGVTEASLPTNPSIDPGGVTAALVRCGGTNPDSTSRSLFFDVSVTGSGLVSALQAGFRVRCTVLPAPVQTPDIELRFLDGTPMPAGAILDLGEVAADATVAGSFRVANVGSASLTINGVSVSPNPAQSGSDDAADMSSFHYSVAAGQDAFGIVRCGRPNPSGVPVSHSFAVLITSNDPDEGTVSFNVHCTVLPEPRPDIELRFADGTPMPANATIDLGEVASGAEVHGTFNVANVGSGPLQIGGVTIYHSPPYIDAASMFNYSAIAAGQTAAGSVKCGSSNPGAVPVTHSVYVTVFSNDPDEGTVNFTVHCTVLPEPRPDIELRFANGTPMPANATIDLGEVASGAEVHGTFNVANVGSGPLQIGGVTIYHSFPYIDDASMFNYSAIAAGQTAAGSVKCGSSNPGAVPVTHSVYVTVFSNDPDEGTVSFTVHCTVLPEAVPPTITAIAAPGRNANGWNNTNVTVSYTCTDLGPGLNSGVDQAASSLGDDVLTASGTATGTCVDRAGNSASASYTAQIDKTVPTLDFQGNAGTYSVLAMVAITCVASDPLSGVGSTNCQNASGPAWSFGAGPHTLSADATDRAGNTGSASTTFTVTVHSAGLTALTRQFVQSSARYQALRTGQRAAVDAVVTAACNLLLNIRPALAPAQKAQFINAYKQAVQALVAPGWLTATQAVTLRALADAI